MLGAARASAHRPSYCSESLVRRRLVFGGESIVGIYDDGGVMAERAEVVLGGEDREVLERWARRPRSSQALALRCRIVLAAADGEPTIRIAERLGCSRNTVSKWRGRFARRGFDGLHDSRGRASRARLVMIGSSG